MTAIQMKSVANGLFSPKILIKKGRGEGRMIGNKIPISTKMIAYLKLT